jgi:hypothetical protein
MLSTSLEVQFLNKAKQDLGGKTNIFLGCRMCIWSKEAKVLLKKTFTEVNWVVFCTRCLKKAI